MLTSSSLLGTSETSPSGGITLSIEMTRPPGSMRAQTLARIFAHDASSQSWRMSFST